MFRLAFAMIGPGVQAKIPIVLMLFWAWRALHPIGSREPAFFLSENGELSARLSATYEILLTQRIVLQPRLDLNAAFSDAPEFSVGSGFNDVEIGLRLRYEISRQVAPYLGVAWKRQLGKTADLTRAAGDSVKDVRFVIGIRVWW